MKEFETEERTEKEETPDAVDSALKGQLSWNLYPGRRILKWVGLALLLLLLVFLLVKMIQAPADGVSLHPESTTVVREQPAPETESPEIETPANEQTETGTESDPGTVESTAASDEALRFFAPIEWLHANGQIPPAEDRTPQESVTLLALGDNLMHNTVMWAGQTAYGYNYNALYHYIKDDVQAADIACINQETIFINDPNQFTNYPSFGGPVQIGEALIDTGFDVIEHATNHCYDKFTAGITDTLNFWHQHPEITVLGIHDSQEDADTIRVIVKNGIRIAFLNYTYGTNAGYPEKSYMIDYLDDRKKIAADIKKAKELSDFVIVFPHWGSENTFTPNDSQRQWAQFFADNGVGAVIGCHTHTLQPVELITREDGVDMPVYWSLGNFISHMAHARNMLGGMAKLTISKDSYGAYASSVELVPTMTYGTHDNGKWEFYGMKLSDYNDYMAKHHLIDGTSVAEMEALYKSIIGED
ncbi:MAG: CapA family protein [Oscillospiraceae bacterium]|nr:CapA family protein [Oscillospiraceae bacterium]